MSEMVVETRDLSMRFGGVLAVNNVNFNLRERELRCLIGPNGAGKSTLFKCMTGLHQINHGVPMKSCNWGWVSKPKCPRS